MCSVLFTGRIRSSLFRKSLIGVILKIQVYRRNPS